MGILERAKEDWQKLSQSSFDLDLFFETPDSSQTATIKGIGTKNHIKMVLTDGQDAIGQNTHIGFSELVLKEANPNYPIRNARNEVAMHHHKVTFADSNGVKRTYQIKQQYPDETIGMIMCDCADFTQTN